MFYILIYIFNKNLEFYNRNLIEFDFETFGRTNKFDIPIPDSEIEKLPYVRPAEDSPEMQY